MEYIETVKNPKHIMLIKSAIRFIEVCDDKFQSMDVFITSRSFTSNLLEFSFVLFQKNINTLVPF